VRDGIGLRGDARATEIVSGPVEAFELHGDPHGAEIVP
jgi:hypothetical protein